MKSLPDEISREPQWRPAARVLMSQVPASLRSWLLDTGSLTQRLLTAAAGDFRVAVLRQRWLRPMRNETRALNMRMNQSALVREVALICHGTPWVYARTIIPRTTMTGAERRLARLRSRSLGAVLFADPSTERGEFELVRLTPGERLYQEAAVQAGTPPAEVWGRRACFKIKDKPLLVSEFFLPALGAFPEK